MMGFARGCSLGMFFGVFYWGYYVEGLLFAKF
jgi:hypothetical protein